MNKRLVAYNDVLMPADSTPAANQIPILDNNGAINAVGVISSGNISGTKAVVLSGLTTITTTGSIDGTVSNIRLDASGGVLTAILPAVATVTGLILFIKRINASNLPTIKGSGSENIDGANTYTGLSAQYKAVILYANGTSWDILAGF